MDDANKEPVNSDSGLGLEGFLKRPAGEEKAKIEPAPVAPKATPSLDVKPTKVEAPLPAKEPAKVAVKAGAKADKTAEPAKAGDPTTPAAPNWDDATNPWKQKADEFDKRYRDTHRDWNRLNQGNQELQRQLAVLGKKVDGTYDAAVDEPRQPTPEQSRMQGQVSGRAEASLASAFRTHGEDVVMKSLERYAQIFGKDPAVQQRILMGQDPVQGAMDAVKGFEFFEKYGNDPTAILENAKKEFEAEHLPKLREAEAKRIMAEMAAKRGGGEPKGLSGVQGGSSDMDHSITKENAGRAKPISTIFNNF